MIFLVRWSDWCVETDVNWAVNFFAMALVLVRGLLLKNIG